ncbi:DNA polymerase IV [Rothia sp. CCM 9418]|uniref:DNA polymerase IV n=1 Tax=unclassified Rothia (in: high G+C Gram-positive bacteria) TaxID=2689056 RepID=UPI003ACD037E
MSESPSKIIMHLDMDAFFVNVELLHRNCTIDAPVIVAKEGARSVVLSASYSARAYGVRSAMPLLRARSLCPQAVIIPPSADYAQYSQQMLNILRSYSSLVEKISIDEAFVDLSGTVRTLGHPVHTAQQMQRRIMSELSLPCSIGLGPTKFIAKMASSASKPHGLWVIEPHQVQEFLDPLPVEKLWGVGSKTQQLLADIGVRTVSQLREHSRSFLMSRFGTSAGSHLYDIARGIDLREVIPERPTKSVGAEYTFYQDVSSYEQVQQELLKLSLSVGARLRKIGKYASTISIKIRYADFQTVTRSTSLESINSGQKIYAVALEKIRELSVFDSHGFSYRGIRLIGVRAENLRDVEKGIQCSLFETFSGENYSAESMLCSGNERWSRAEEIMDQIHERFGSQGIMPAKLLGPFPLCENHEKS